MKILWASLFSLVYIYTSTQAASRSGGGKTKQYHKKKHEKPTLRETQTCPDGYCLENNKCVKKTEVPFLYECSMTSSEIDGECVSYIPTKKQCPDECSLSPTRCVCQSVSDPVAICPEGLDLEGQDCVVAYPVAESCPSGTAPVGDMCAKVETVQHRCPDNNRFRREGMLCVREEYADPIPVCADQMELNEGVCRTSTSVQPSCRRGTTDIGDTCATYHRPMAECPEGFTLSGSTCKQVTFQEKMDACPNGGDPNDNCKLIVQGPMSPTCSHIPGSMLIEDSCVTKHTSPASYNCPDGYDLNGNVCITEIPYDCSTTEYSVECVEPPVCNTDDGIVDKCVPVCSHKKKTDCLPMCSETVTSDCVVRDESSNLRQLTAHKEKKGHKAYKIRHNDPAPVCQRVPLVNQQTCQRSLTAQPAPYCEEGVFRGGSTCEVTQFSEPQYKCDAETDENGECVMLQYAPTLYSCPQGTTDIGHRCSTTQTAYPTEKCPPGTENSPGCPTYEEKSCPGNDCTRVHYQDPRLTCPEGYTRREKRTVSQSHTHPHVQHHMHKSRRSLSSIAKKDMLQAQTFKHNRPVQPEKVVIECKKTIYADLISNCREATEPIDELTCASYVPRATEDRVVQVTAQLLCQQGSYFDGRHCVAESYVNFNPECPFDTVPLDDYHCMRINQKEQRCPRGSFYEDGVCYVKESMKALTVDTYA